MAIIDGTPGNDILNGTAGESNILNLEAGNDIGTGAELDDILDGNEGNDILIGAGGDGNILNGDSGQDLLTGGGLSPFPEEQAVFDTLDVTGISTLNAGEDEDIAGEDNGVQ